MTGQTFVFNLREDIYPAGWSYSIGELDAPQAMPAGSGNFFFREEWYV
jgi:hypothetical protein